MPPTPTLWFLCLCERVEHTPDGKATVVGMFDNLEGDLAFPFEAVPTIGFGVYPNGATGEWVLSLELDGAPLGQTKLVIGREAIADQISIPMNFIADRPHLLVLKANGLSIGKLPIKPRALTRH